MFTNSFIKAKPIYAKEYQREMNISLFFCFDFYGNKIKVSGNSWYRIFDNGRRIMFGPAKAAHTYARVDEIKLDLTLHHIVIELSGYNCNSYHHLNTAPFILFEAMHDDVVVAFSDLNTQCYLNETRVQKVTRFSFQRTFSESYKFKTNIDDFYQGKNQPFKKLQVDEINEVINLLPRNVPYPLLSSLNFCQIDQGRCEYNEKNKVYEDRYMYTKHRLIFDKETWEENPNDLISKLDYYSEDITSLKENQYVVYSLLQSKTGMVEFVIDALEDSEVYFVFDEVNTGEDGKLQIDFYRNTTHNIVSYKFKKGHYHHEFFEPYTIKYLRIVVIKGLIEINSIKLNLFENPLINKIEYDFKDQKVKKVMDAAVSTFAQNALDILTDCPSRERAGWLCDSYFTGQAESLITGHNIIEKNFLENYAYVKKFDTLPEGMIPMCYPAEHEDGVFIPNWSLFYILELEQFFNKNNSLELKELSLKNVRGLLNYFKRFENEFELLEDLENWVFVEWSKANDEEFIKGVNIPSNMLYADALRAAGLLLEDESLVEKSKRIKKTIVDIAFNGQFFVDNLIRVNGALSMTTNTSETNQYYAFYFNIVDKNTHHELFERLINCFGPTRDYENVYKTVYKSNVIMGDYLRLKILVDNGYLSKAYDESILYFYKMAEITGTLWEHDSLFASLNHGLTSYIVNIIVRIIFGITKIDYLNNIIYISKNVIKTEAKVNLPLKDQKIEIVNENGRLIVKDEVYKVIYQD